MSFQQLWFLDDKNGQAIPVFGGREAASNKKNNNSSSSNNPTKEPSWNGLRTNDLLFFPEKLTGVGEFEGCQFVGERTDEGLPLLPAGIGNRVLTHLSESSCGIR